METIYEPGMVAFDPIMIVCEFESVLFGNYNRISFAHQDLNNPEIGNIQNQVAYKVISYNHT